ncbi:MAG: helix-turn-helix transcriptional regulator [Bacteroidetes bacterium]|nr:helix-turn-helix transcriptional regulator [Bacteroidota bacterium]MCL6102567.1 helix-turn-helix transcriptional regulator [Bacteroidota bacterium]
MNHKISDFFEPIKATQYIGSDNYAHVERYLNALKAISKLCDLSYYIIDYYRKNFFYVSSNPLFLCGYSQEEVLKLGYDFYGECVPYEDLLLLFELNEAGFNFFYELPVERRESATISYDFRLKHKSNNSLVMINHKLAPLLLTEDGNIWMAICLVTLSSRKSSGDVHIIMQDNHTRHNFSREEKLFKRTEVKKLSKKESEVLKYIATGYCMDRVASIMNISVSTIKNHKTSILKKMQVENITEAVFNASKQGVL